MLPPPASCSPASLPIPSLPDLEHPVLARGCRLAFALLLACAATLPATASAVEAFSGLGSLPGAVPGSEATAVSPDGSTVVGHYLSPSIGADSGAFVWHEIGGTSLHLQDTVARISSITAISGDMLVMSAWTGVYDAPRALRFTESGSQPLPQLSAIFQFSGSTAQAISADGSTIVGQSWGQAFRWQSGTGTVGLGLVNPDGDQAYSSALAVSADGGVVVGTSSELICNPFPDCVEDQRAMAWTPRRGLTEIRVELESLGLDLTGWTLREATGVSADGTVIVGRGIDASGDAEAWRAELPSLAWPAQVPALPGRTLLFILAVGIAAAATPRLRSLASASE